MKQLLVLLMLPAMAFAQVQSKTCPHGDKPAEASTSDLKNRYTTPTSYTTLDFTTYANKKYDISQIAYCNTAVSLTGVVLEVEDGGLEACNCHSATNKDTHIYLVKDATVTDKSEAVIVEATPAFRAALGTTEQLMALKGKKVTVYGYAFEDPEHKANCVVDGGKGNLWRHTRWEVHPITKIVKN